MIATTNAKAINSRPTGITIKLGDSEDSVVKLGDSEDFDVVSSEYKQPSSINKSDHYKFLSYFIVKVQ